MAPTVVKKQHRKIGSSQWWKIFAIYVKWGFFGSRNACVILQAQSFERTEQIVCCYGKSNIHKDQIFGLKMNLLKFPSVKSSWNCVGVKGICSGGLYKKN